MGRHGMQSFGIMILVSLSLLVLLNQYAAFDWLATSSSLSLSSALSVAAGSKSLSSYGIEDLHGAEMRRRLLQVTPAPAPAPASAGSGLYIGYGVLTADYTPCPPQSGRSYYTSNCENAEGPANPYTRGCSAISMCARD